jgi:hypothetical protein
MSKETIRVNVLDDLSVYLVFKEDEDHKKEVKLILPDIVKERWDFKSPREESAFAAYASAIGNDFITFGLSAEEVAAKFKILIERTVKANLLNRK